MRDGVVECPLRLGDRVRWLIEDKPELDIHGTDPIGMVTGLSRRFALSPDLAIDRVLIRFDKRIHLIEGMHGFLIINADYEQVEVLQEAPAQTEEKPDEST